MGVFAGHFHRFGPNLKIGRIKYYITGGGGGKLTRVYARAGGTHHFVLATASDAGLVVKVVTPDGIFSEEDADVVRKKSAAASRPPAS